MFNPEPSVNPAVRATTVIAVSMVATVAAAVSFMHMHTLAVRAGEGWRSWLVPLAVDGLVVAASMTMLVRRRAGKPAGWLTWASMGAGITASLAANVAAAEPTLIGRAVAAWPPLALLLAYELLMDQMRMGNTHGAQHPAEPPAVEHSTMPASRPPVAAPTNVSAQESGHVAIPVSKTESANEHMPHARLAGIDGIDGKPAAPGTAGQNGNRGTAPPGPILRPVRYADAADATRDAARHHYRHTLATGQPCTGKQLAERYGMSERWGRYQIRAARTTITLATAEPAAR